MVAAGGSKGGGRGLAQKTPSTVPGGKKQSLDNNNSNNSSHLYGILQFTRNTSDFFFFLTALGLCCCAQAFSSCGEWGLLFLVVQGLLIAVASLVTEHRLQACGLSSCGLRAVACRLSSCGAWAQLLRGMWDLPGPRLARTSAPCIGRWILNHCATREVPSQVLLSSMSLITTLHGKLRTIRKVRAGSPLFSI